MQWCVCVCVSARAWDENLSLLDNVKEKFLNQTRLLLLHTLMYVLSRIYFSFQSNDAAPFRSPQADYLKLAFRNESYC